MKTLFLSQLLGMISISITCALVLTNCILCSFMEHFFATSTARPSLPSPFAEIAWKPGNEKISDLVSCNKITSGLFACVAINCFSGAFHLLKLAQFHCHMMSSLFQPVIIIFGGLGGPLERYL